MRTLRAPRQSSADYLTHSRGIAAGSEDSLCRHEPQTLTGRTAPADPYAAWLQQREADREREQQEPVRWVFRQRIAGGPAAGAAGIGRQGSGTPRQGERAVADRLTAV
jgi:hypothetical protein